MISSWSGQRELEACPLTGTDYVTATKAVSSLAKLVQQQDMLVSPDAILEAMSEARTKIPINAIHMYSDLKADLFPLPLGDELRQAAF